MNAPDSPDPDMFDEYDFTNGRRGRYAQRYAEGTNVVVLDPDVVTEFRDSRPVNDALRELIEIRNQPAEDRRRFLGPIRRCYRHAEEKSRQGDPVSRNTLRIGHRDSLPSGWLASLSLSA